MDAEATPRVSSETLKSGQTSNCPASSQHNLSNVTEELARFHFREEDDPEDQPKSSESSGSSDSSGICMGDISPERKPRSSHRRPNRIGGRKSWHRRRSSLAEREAHLPFSLRTNSPDAYALECERHRERSLASMDPSDADSGSESSERVIDPNRSLPRPIPQRPAPFIPLPKSRVSQLRSRD